MRTEVKATDHKHTCISCAGRTLRRHAVSLQRWVRDGQQAMVTQIAPYALMGVEQPTLITAWDGYTHVIVGGGQTLHIEQTKPVVTGKETQSCLKQHYASKRAGVNIHRFSVGWSSGQCLHWFSGIYRPTLGSGQQSHQPRCQGFHSRLNPSFAGSG